MPRTNSYDCKRPGNLAFDSLGYIYLCPLLITCCSKEGDRTERRPPRLNNVPAGSSRPLRPPCDSHCRPSHRLGLHLDLAILYIHSRRNNHSPPSLVGVNPGPLPRLRNRSLLVVLPVLRHVVRERVVRVRSAKERLDGEPAGELCGADVPMPCKTTHRTVRIWRAGDHLSFRMSRQIRPSLSMLGWLASVWPENLGEKEEEVAY